MGVSQLLIPNQTKLIIKTSHQPNFIIIHILQKSLLTLTYTLTSFIIFKNKPIIIHTLHTILKLQFYNYFLFSSSLGW